MLGIWAALKSTKWDLILIAIAVSAAAGGFLGWHERGLRVPAELATQQSKDATDCSNKGKITKEAYDDLLKNRNDSADKCAAALRVRPSCVPVYADGADSVASPQRGSDHPLPVGKPTGLSSTWLRAYQSQCELIQADYHACVKHDTACVAEK